MWRHGSFQTRILGPKILLTAHQRRSGNCSACSKEKQKEKNFTFQMQDFKN